MTGSAVLSVVRELPPTFIDELRTLFGGRLSLHESQRRQHGMSEAHFDTRLPDAVVHPHSTEEVATLVKCCVRHAVPLIAFGAGTSLEGNTIPVAGGVTVDMSEMNAVLSVNAEDFDCTVQAGVRREQLNEYLRDTGLFFPVDPDSWWHGLDACVGHQCRALWHHAGGGSVAARGDARWFRDSYGAARA